MEGAVMSSHVAYLQEKIGIKNVSPIGAIMADMLGNIYQGLHHVDDVELKHGVFQRTDCASFPMSTNFAGGVSTVDNNVLTRLLVMAHDNCVAMDIIPLNYNHINIYIEPSSRTLVTPIESYLTNEPPYHETLFDMFGVEQITLSQDMNDVTTVKISGDGVYLSNYSESLLTKLVVWAHWACYRVALIPRNNKSFQLLVSKRLRYGRLHEYCPTLRQHIDIIRGVSVLDKT